MGICGYGIEFTGGCLINVINLATKHQKNCLDVTIDVKAILHGTELRLPGRDSRLPSTIRNWV